MLNTLRVCVVLLSTPMLAAASDAAVRFPVRAPVRTAVHSHVRPTTPQAVRPMVVLRQLADGSWVEVHYVPVAQVPRVPLPPAVAKTVPQTSRGASRRNYVQTADLRREWPDPTPSRQRVVTSSQPKPTPGTSSTRTRRPIVLDASLGGRTLR